MMRSRSWAVAISGMIFTAGGQVLAEDPAFTERAADAGVSVAHSAFGYSLANYAGGGVVGDFNNDGWQDLFALSGGGNGSDHLFINNGDGTFTDEAAAWHLSEVHKGKGASVGDINADGWLDIYVTSAGTSGNIGPGQHRLYRNNGDGTFSNIAAEAGVNYSAPFQQDGWGSSFGDFDLDGDLDLFVAGFAQNNAGTIIFENDGTGHFTNITDDIGFFDGTPNLASFAPRFADMNGDWYPEVLLVADFGSARCRYFRNNGDGTFTDVTSDAGTGQEENGMGQNIGDINNDGRIDWYTTSIYDGSNWTGNKLYLNHGAHQYQEVAGSVGVDDGGYGWGSVLVDFNHDGRVDIAETNGGSGNPYANEQSYLWIQQENGQFTEMALASGFEHFGQGRGMVNFDYDNDGDQDVVIFANNELLTLFNNDISGPDANWLRVFLDTSDEPALAPNGHGARVWATAGEQTQVRLITSGDNFLSHSELSAHFGLGAANAIDELRVDWPDGTSTVQTNVAVNQTMTVAHAAPVVGDLDGDGSVGAFDLAILLGAWGPCADCGDCPADLDGDCDVGAFDLALLLGNWGPGP